MNPFPEPTYGFRYMLVIIDLFSHYLYVCPLTAKSDAFMNLMSFVLLVEMHFISESGHFVKCFHSDNGGNVMPASLCPGRLKSIQKILKWLHSFKRDTAWYVCDH